MNLSHLRYALEVERTGSITKAAQSLYMSQPNLSKAIRELEEEIGFPIFRRSSRGVEPTQRGAEFLGYAARIASQIDELEHLYKPGPKSLVELGISAPHASYIASAFAEFACTFSGESRLALRFQETGPLGAAGDVSSGMAAFGVVRLPVPGDEAILGRLRDQGLDWQPLWTFSFGLLLSPAHPLACYDDVPAELLSGFTELVFSDFREPPVSPAQHRPPPAEPASRQVYLCDRGSQADVLCALPGSYMWVSPLSPDHLRRLGLVFRPCSGLGLRGQDLLVYPRRRSLSPYGQRFLTQLGESIRACGGVPAPNA